MDIVSMVNIQSEKQANANNISYLSFLWFPHCNLPPEKQMEQF